MVVASAIPLPAEAVLVERNLTPDPAYRWIEPFPRVLAYDTVTGLEWVDLSETVPGTGTAHSPDSREWYLSGNDPYQNPFSAGWRYATHAEICGLLEPRTGPLNGCGGGAGAVGSYEGIAEIQEFLGLTAESGGLKLVNGIYETGMVQMTLDTATRYAVAGVFDTPGDPPNGGGGIGHFLVRVSEPSSMLLASLALCAVATRRKATR
jgi:hypothetical protein